MGGERGARLEPRQDRAALGRVHLVFPDLLLAYSRTRLDPWEVAQREDLRRRPAASLRQRLHATGDDREHGRAVRRRDGVHTAVRPIAYVPGRHRAELVRDGALDDEDQLVADVPMERELGVGLDARHDGPPLALRMLPDAPRPDPGLAFLPREVADRDDLRQRSLRGRHGVASSRGSFWHRGHGMPGLQTNGWNRATGAARVAPGVAPVNEGATRLLRFELQILVGRREGVAGDEPEPGFLHSYIGATIALSCTSCCMR